jgi:hypothetical protein
MITAHDAARVAGEILEVPADDPGHPWELEEFPQGWLIRQRGWKGPGGAGPIVIEREAGQVIYFSSAISPQRVISEYETVRERGQPDGRWLPARNRADANSGAPREQAVPG